MATRASDVQKLLRQAQAQGFRVEERRKCYLAYPPRTATLTSPVSIPKSPNGRRMLTNAQADLRRRGFDPDRHEAVAAAIEGGHREIVPATRPGPRLTKEQVETRLNGEPIHANGRAINGATLAPAPLNGVHKEPITTIEREPVATHPGLERILLSDGQETYGCAICPEIKTRTLEEAAAHHHRHAINRGQHKDLPPLGELIADRLRDDLLNVRHGWKTGARLPTGRELAVRFGVSEFSISQAWKFLIREGLIETHPGQGAIVLHVPAVPVTEPAPETPMPTPPNPVTPALLAATLRPVTRPTPAPAQPPTAAPTDPQADLLKCISNLRDIAGRMDDNGAAANQLAEARRQATQAGAERDQAIARANSATTRAEKAEAGLAAYKQALKVIQSL